MPSGGEGDGGRLRIGGWLPDPDFEPSDQASGSTGGARRDRAVTGETPSRASARGPVDHDEWGGPEAERDPGAEPWDDPAGRGPTALAADAWDTTTEVDWTSGAYKGRRRAGGPAARLWVVVLVLVGLGIAVAIPLALTSSPDGAAPATPGRTAQGQPLASGPTAANPSSSPSSSPSAEPTAPPFTPVAYEAEAPSNTRGGSARVRNVQGASGRRVVTRIGDWSDSELIEADNGTLRFNAVNVPATGAYTLTIFYTFLEEEDPTRSAVITVGDASTNVSFSRPSSGCCSASATVAVTLTEGANTILFANTVSHAPAVDKIVISYP